MFIKSSRSTFQIIRRNPVNNNGDSRQYRLRLEKVFIYTLLVFVILFVVSKRIPEKARPVMQSGNLPVFSVDMIPATRQGGIPRPPNLPSIPVPTEDEFVLDDETIDETYLDMETDIPLFDSDGPWGRGTPAGHGPRPIREVIPEYPNSERRRGIKGIVVLDILVNAEGAVDSVVVVRNTSLSQRLAAVAKSAAYRSIYTPAERDGRKVSHWIRRPYQFGDK